MGSWPSRRTLPAGGRCLDDLRQPAARLKSRIHSYGRARLQLNKITPNQLSAPRTVVILEGSSC